MVWTRAIHLDLWSNELISRGQLPILIRRLIRRTVASLRSADFPAMEQGQRPGFDGVVDCSEATQFVPIGRSGWELGTGKDFEKKANEDFRSRTKEIPKKEQRQMTFVFVTPRNWRREDRDEWIKEKFKVSAWRDIIVLDGNDLEHWLELAPDIDIWFSRLTGRVPTDVQDLQSYWEALRCIAEPPLVPSVFTTSRDEQRAAVATWLSASPSALFMRSSGLTDGLDFLAALAAGEDQDKLQCGIVVRSVEIWRNLAPSRDSLVLLPMPTLELDPSDVSAAVSAGHHVFISGPRVTSASGAAIDLRRQDYYSISQALVASGTPESRAMAWSKACAGSSSILKRLITRHPATMFPPWARDDVRATLAPFALLGGWAHVDPEPRPRDPEMPPIGSDPPSDILFVTELARCSRDDLDQIVARWHVGLEPLFLRFRDTVHLASREEAWHLLGGGISGEQLRRFADLACLVLEEDNPAFELAPDERWMANLYGKTHTLSGEFRQSLVESVVLMSGLSLTCRRLPRQARRT